MFETNYNVSSSVQLLCKQCSCHLSSFHLDNNLFINPASI